MTMTNQPPVSIKVQPAIRLHSSKNSAWQAFKETVFTIAFIHLVILVYATLTQQNTDYLNVVNVLSLPLITDLIPVNTTTFVLGGISMLALAAWNYRRNQTKYNATSQLD